MCSRLTKELRDWTEGCVAFAFVAWILVVVMSFVLVFGINGLKANPGSIESIVILALMILAEVLLLYGAVLLTYISATTPRARPSEVVRAVAPQMPETRRASPQNNAATAAPIPEEGEFTRSNPMGNSK